MILWRHNGRHNVVPISIRVTSLTLGSYFPTLVYKRCKIFNCLDNSNKSQQNKYVYITVCLALLNLEKVSWWMALTLLTEYQCWSQNIKLRSTTDFNTIVLNHKIAVCDVCFTHDDVIKWKHFPVTSHLCGEWPVTGEFYAQRPVTRSFDVFFDLRLNKPLRKQWWDWWFETPSRPLWRHSNIFPYCFSLQKTMPEPVLTAMSNRHIDAECLHVEGICRLITNNLQRNKCNYDQSFT